MFPTKVCTLRVLNNSEKDRMEIASAGQNLGKPCFRSECIT